MLATVTKCLIEAIYRKMGGCGLTVKRIQSVLMGKQGGWGNSVHGL